MANITVSPTRMELTRLKGKLKTAQRGHKLLKDKRDELMKQFLDTVREVRSLRAEVEEDLMRVHKSFTVASALMSSEALEQALLYRQAERGAHPHHPEHYVRQRAGVRFPDENEVGFRHLPLRLRRHLR